MKGYVIIVAGGKGERMHSDLPKQFIPIDGKPVLMHTLERFGSLIPDIELIVVLPKDQQEYWRTLCREIGCDIPHRIVEGGETRFYSVKNALDAIEDEISGFREEGFTYIAVHDGVRPIVTPDFLVDCFAFAEEHGNAVPVIPMTDSIRERTDGNKSRPVDRDRYVRVQTPQVFLSNTLIACYKQPYSPEFTDDASVVEKLFPIHTCPGLKENIKITSPMDLLTVEAILSQFKKQSESRT